MPDTCEHGAFTGSYWQPPDECRRCAVWSDTVWNYTGPTEHFPDPLAEARQALRYAVGLQLSAASEREYVHLGQDVSEIASECRALERDRAAAPVLGARALFALRLREAVEIAP